MDKLQQNKIIKRKIKNCSCNQSSFIYLLPIKITEDILKYLTQFGTPAFELKKTSILKIENQNYSITGVRRLKEIRVNLKKETNGFFDLLEDALINYVKGE